MSDGGFSFLGGTYASVNDRCEVSTVPGKNIDSFQGKYSLIILVVNRR
jgi:hypothetical protein